VTTCSLVVGLDTDVSENRAASIFWTEKLRYPEHGDSLSTYKASHPRRLFVILEEFRVYFKKIPAENGYGN
jgi:hypothetical protein